MDTTNAFDVDQARLGAAAVRLPPEHFDEFQRLEALRIRKEEQLPVYERLGDVRERAICMTKIALGLYERGAPGDRLEAERLLTVALDDATRCGLADAESISRWLARVRTEASD